MSFGGEQKILFAGVEVGIFGMLRVHIEEDAAIDNGHANRPACGFRICSTDWLSPRLYQLSL